MERWEGFYLDLDEKGDEKKFPFYMDVELEADGNFSGTLWEDEFFTLSQKLIDVQGSLIQNQIHFTIKYPYQFDLDENFKALVDFTKPGHEVRYSGMWLPNYGIWTGEWEIKGDLILSGLEFYEEEYYGGGFELKRWKE